MAKLSAIKDACTEIYKISTESEVTLPKGRLAWHVRQGEVAVGHKRTMARVSRLQELLPGIGASMEEILRPSQHTKLLKVTDEESLRQGDMHACLVIGARSQAGLRGRFRLLLTFAPEQRALALSSCSRDRNQRMRIADSGEQRLRPRRSWSLLCSIAFTGLARGGLHGPTYEAWGQPRPRLTSF